MDDLGLDRVDRTILTTMMKKSDGRPVGLDTLAATTGEDAVTIEDVVEPYLMQLGFIMRTPRGRICTQARLRPHENPNASVRQAGRADEFTGLTEGYVGALPQPPERRPRGSLTSHILPCGTCSPRQRMGFRAAAQRSPCTEKRVAMKTSDFDYELPQELIAQTPVEPRDSSRLLVYHRDAGAVSIKSSAT